MFSLWHLVDSKLIIKFQGNQKSYIVFFFFMVPRVSAPNLHRVQGSTVLCAGAGGEGVSQDCGSARRSLWAFTGLWYLSVCAQAHMHIFHSHLNAVPGSFQVCLVFLSSYCVFEAGGLWPHPHHCFLITYQLLQPSVHLYFLF